MSTIQFSNTYHTVRYNRTALTMSLTVGQDRGQGDRADRMGRIFRILEIMYPVQPDSPTLYSRSNPYLYRHTDVVNLTGQCPALSLVTGCHGLSRSIIGCHGMSLYPSTGRFEVWAFKLLYSQAP